jgi:hypothetical protein
MMAEVLDLEVRVPASLYTIPLINYQRYMQVVEGIDTDTDESTDFLNLKALEVFCGLELKESYKLPLSAFSSILEQLANCLAEETPLVKRFTMRGTDGAQIEFGFNPNLRDMSFGEYVDLDAYIGSWKDAHKAMAVLYRPIIASKSDMYRIEDYESSDKYSGLLKYMPTSVALGALVFFYRLGMKLAKRSLNSSLSQVPTKELLKAEKQSLEKDGVGISRYMLLLEVMSQNLTKLQHNHYISV